MRWSLLPSTSLDELTAFPNSYLAHERVTPEGVFARYAWDFDGAEDIATALQRVLCHVLVDQVRCEAVPDLLATIRDLRDAHDLVASTPRLPESAARTVRGVITRTSVQPPFEIELE